MKRIKSTKYFSERMNEGGFSRWPAAGAIEKASDIISEAFSIGLAVSDWARDHSGKWSLVAVRSRGLANKTNCHSLVWYNDSI